MLQPQRLMRWRRNHEITVEDVPADVGHEVDPPKEVTHNQGENKEHLEGEDAGGCIYPLQ